MLSVIIITKNEAQRIRHCLESVSWADEIILVDSGSVDATVAIAQEFTPKIIVTDWPGFGKQKNRALAHATGDWVFSIDADEWVDAALQQEIQAIIADPRAMAAYFIPRRTQYLGAWVDHGDAGQDKVIRLFKRGQAQFSEDVVHERVLVNGAVGVLKNPLLHNSYRSIEELIERMNRYSTLSANSRWAKGQSSSLRKAIWRGVWAFIRSYILRRGFLDGRIGFVVAVSSAESSYYRHLKLAWYKQNMK